MILRIQGILLFLFIPIVLILYLAFPLGVLPSILTGMVLMFGHRFIAVPFMKKNIDKRCIWSGNRIESKDKSFKMKLKKYELTFFAENEKNKILAIKFFNFLYKYRFVIKPAILITVFWYLVSVLGGELFEGFYYIKRDTMILIFKMIIAFTVTIGSILYRFGSIDLPTRTVFPPHNLFLLGISWTLWIFRIVGIWWIVTGLLTIFG